MSFTTEHKTIIRQQWSGKLIKFLSKRLEKKLLYLGLPSPDIEDLQEWIDYLEKVVAFQCNDERYPNAYERLVENLRALERQNKITTWSAYNGFIEQVVLQGYDLQDDTQFFNLSDVVTLYNLDFCNSISSPIELLDEAGNIKNAYKFNAVQKLLEIQNSLGVASTKFILFLTVHCSYDGGELQAFIEGAAHKDYLKQVAKHGDAMQRDARIVRLFCVETLSYYLRAANFIPKFFPTILYYGLKGTPLLHFTVIGTRTQGAGLVPWHQTTEDLVRSKLISIDDQGFYNLAVDGFEEGDSLLDPINAFAQSKVFQKYWGKSTTPAT